MPLLQLLGQFTDQHDVKTKRQKDKKTTRQQDNKKEDKDQKESLILRLSGQFRTLAMFFTRILLVVLNCTFQVKEISSMTKNMPSAAQKTPIDIISINSNYVIGWWYPQLTSLSG